MPLGGGRASRSPPADCRRGFRPRPYGDPMGARPAARRGGSAVLGAAVASVAIIITWSALSPLPRGITPYHLGLLLPWAAVILWRVHRRPRANVPPLRYVLRDKTAQRPPILVDSANVDMSVIRWRLPHLEAGHWPQEAVMLSALARSLGRNEPVWNESYAEELGIAVEPMPRSSNPEPRASEGAGHAGPHENQTVKAVPGGTTPNVADDARTGLPPDDAVTQQRPRRRYLLQVSAAAVVAASGVCLPYLVTRNDTPREWGGLVLLGNTLLAALLVLIVGGLLVALGRIRPSAGAFGRGALRGVLLGGVLWAALLIVLPGPPPEPLPQTPPQPSQAAPVLPTASGGVSLGSTVLRRR
jgi:hypothetical protein